MDATSTSSGGVTQEQVRRQYRRIAAHVHPDKCDLSGAEGAFLYVSQAHDQLQKQYNSSTAAGASSGCAFNRQDDARSAAGSDAGASDWSGDGQCCGFQWWGRWETADTQGAAAQHFAWSTQPAKEHEEGRLWEIPLEVRPCVCPGWMGCILFALEWWNR